MQVFCKILFLLEAGDKNYFSNAPEIPLLRTLDIDFLIPNPPRIHKEVNIPEILEDLDFIPLQNYMTGYTKYVHPELELELYWKGQRQ